MLFTRWISIGPRRSGRAWGWLSRAALSTTHLPIRLGDLGGDQWGLGDLPYFWASEVCPMLVGSVLALWVGFAGEGSVEGKEGRRTEQNKSQVKEARGCPPNPCMVGAQLFFLSLERF